MNFGTQRVGIYRVHILLYLQPFVLLLKGCKAFGLKKIVIHEGPDFTCALFPQGLNNLQLLGRLSTLSFY